MSLQDEPVFERLIRELSGLPGIGRRSAERIALHLLRQDRKESLALAEAIRSFTQDLKVCPVCGNVSEAAPCPICCDAKRDHSLVIVVEQPSDVATLEQVGAHRGVYHVLMGRLAPMEGVGPGELNVQPLLDRAAGKLRLSQADRDAWAGSDASVREVVLATNPTLEGDGTAMYLSEKLEALGVEVTRLARGMPTGSALATVSKAVLSDAIQGRGHMPA